LVVVFDTGGVVSGTQGTAGIVALLLELGDFAVKAAEDINHLGEGGQVRFDIFGASGLLEEDLREPGGGGLEADFGQFGGVFAAEMIGEVVLVEAVLQEEVLFEAPFEVAAGGPVGDVTFGDVEPEVVEGANDILIGDTIPDHAADHIALEFGEGSDATFAAGFVGLGGSGEGFGVNDGGRGGGGNSLKAKGGLGIEEVIEG
jgi:hypothetical protein